MKKALIFGLMSLITACVTTQYKTVSQEIEFRQRVVDRPLSWPGGFEVQFTNDGRITGNFPQGAVNGNWQWMNNQFCRSIRIRDIARPDECLTIELSEKQVRFRRTNGSYFLPYRIGENPN